MLPPTGANAQCARPLYYIEQRARALKTGSSQMLHSWMSFAVFGQVKVSSEGRNYRNGWSGQSTLIFNQPCSANTNTSRKPKPCNHYILFYTRSLDLTGGLQEKSGSEQNLHYSLVSIGLWTAESCKVFLLSSKSDLLNLKLRCFQVTVTQSNFSLVVDPNMYLSWHKSEMFGEVQQCEAWFCLLLGAWPPRLSPGRATHLQSIHWSSSSRCTCGSFSTVSPAWFFKLSFFFCSSLYLLPQDKERIWIKVNGDKNHHNKPAQ